MWHLIYRLLLVLLMLSLAITLLPYAALAQEESLKLEATHLRIESTTPLEGFEFAVALKYEGHEARTFDLWTSGPVGWITYVTPSYGSTKISAIELQPNKAEPDQVKVTAIPPAHIVPYVGEYRITLRCRSGAITDSINLVAVVMPSHDMTLTLFHDRYYNEVRVGRDNTLSMSIQNNSNRPLNNIRFTPQKPAGWTIYFEPEEIHYLDAHNSQPVNIIIRPDDDTREGDYQITIKAETDQATSAQTIIRVRVKPSVTLWLWIGVVILCILIATFIVIFIRSGRRQTG